MTNAENNSPALRDVLWVLFKHKGLIVGIFLFSMLCAIMLSLVIKPTYKADSRIFVRIGRENLYIPILPFKESINPGINLNKERIINSEIQILKSRTLAEEVIRKIGSEKILGDSKSKVRRRIRETGSDSRKNILFEKALLKFQKKLAVKRVKDSNVIAVSFKHHDPEVAADAVNKLVDLYLYRRLAIHRSPQSYDFFKKQEQILDNKVRQAEIKYQEFKKAHQISSLAEERSLLIHKISDLRIRLNETMAHQAGLKGRVILLKRQMRSLPKTIEREKEIGQNTLLLSNLQTRLAELESQRENLITRYREDSRTIKNIDEQIQLMRERMSGQKLPKVEKTLSGINTTYQSLQEDLLRSEAQIREIGAAGKIIKKQIAGYSKRLADLNQIELELNRHKQKLDAERENYNFYLTKFEESRILNAMDKEKITSVNLIDVAKPPIKPVSPNILLLFSLAMAAGLFGGITMAILSEFLDNRIGRAREAEQVLGVPVLSTIPEYHSLQNGRQP